jgi:hypothetical protein
MNARMKSVQAHLDQGPPFFLGYLGLHALVVAGLVTAEFPDSESYSHLSLTGADVRLPTVPLLYKALTTDPVRVAGQAVLAAICWWILASVASCMISDRRVRIGLRSVLLMLGLVAPIASWNTVILSESATISLTALLIAAWLRYAQDQRWATAAAAVAATVLWSFTRQTNVLIGLMLTLAALVAIFVGKGRFGVRLSVACALIVISTIGLLELHRNRTLSNGAIAYIIHDRVITDRGRTAWFVGQGMPNPRFDPTDIGRPTSQNPAWYAWLYSHGERTYLRFVATHPEYTLIDPLPFLSGEQASLYHPNRAVFPSLQPDPTPSILSPNADYGRHRDVLPSVVQQFLFDQGQIGALLVLAVLGGGLAWLGWRRFGRDQRLVVPVFVTLSAIPQAYIVWLSGGEATHELDRLSITTAVSVRIGLWVLLAVAADRFVVSRDADDDGGGRIRTSVG